MGTPGGRRPGVESAIKFVSLGGNLGEAEGTRGGQRRRHLLRGASTVRQPTATEQSARERDAGSGRPRLRSGAFVHLLRCFEMLNRRVPSILARSEESKVMGHRTVEEETASSDNAEACERGKQLLQLLAAPHCAGRIGDLRGEGEGGQPGAISGHVREARLGETLQFVTRFEEPAHRHKDSTERGAPGRHTGKALDLRPRGDFHFGRPSLFKA